MNPAAWMFEDWPDGSLMRAGQVLGTAEARLAAHITRALKDLL